MGEFFHVPRALSDEALRLLTSLPMDEIERRLQVPMAADGEVGDLVLAMKELAYDVAPYTCDLLNRAADLLERQALRPIPVSERLPGPGDCRPWPDEPDGTPWCWAFVKGPLGDDAWERRPVSCLTTYKPMHTHWLPAHALPLPEFDHE